MATIKLLPALKDDIFNDIIAKIDAGMAAGSVKIYTGTMPADPSVAVTSQITLAILPLAYPCAAITSHTLVFSAITTDASADASGTATWARIFDSNGNAVFDIDVSTTVGSGALKLNTTAIVGFGPVAISAFVITLP